MTLKIWTAAEAALITRTFGASLKSFRPDVPAHQFVAWTNEDEVPPEAGPGDVVLVCGTKPLESLRRAGRAPKNRTVSSLRETPLKSPAGGW